MLTSICTTVATTTPFVVRKMTTPIGLTTRASARRSKKHRFFALVPLFGINNTFIDRPLEDHTACTHGILSSQKSTMSLLCTAQVQAQRTSASCAGLSCRRSDTPASQRRDARDTRPRNSSFYLPDNFPTVLHRDYPSCFSQFDPSPLSRNSQAPLRRDSPTTRSRDSQTYRNKGTQVLQTNYTPTHRTRGISFTLTRHSVHKKEEPCNTVTERKLLRYVDAVSHNPLRQ